MKNVNVMLGFIILMISCKNEIPQAKVNSESFGYAVVWQYNIQPDSREDFELEYGPKGSWATLFNKSVHYLGSYLSKSQENENSYLLIDTWKSRITYEKFIDENRTTYESLSTQFEKLYVSETKIGSYISLK